MLVVIGLTVVAHEVGLARLARHSRASRVRWRRRRSVAFYAGLGVLALTISSPLDYWASQYFFVHMVEHLLISFAFPVLVVAGAPWVPLLFALPVGPRRSIGRFLFLSPRAGVLRAAGRVVRRPTVALVAFNVVMVAWHIPALFTFSERHAWAHVWLMHTSFIVTGVLFWLQIFPSRPMTPARGPVWRVGAIALTNVVMTVLAISMSVLTSVSWYPTYSHLAGVTLSPFADQQIGAAILWVCGDFWALPAVYLIIHQALQREPGSFTGVIERVIRSRSERDPLSLR